MIALPLFLMVITSAGGSNQLIRQYPTNDGMISVFKTKLVLIDGAGNTIDSLRTDPWAIHDCCISPEKDYLFAILGKPGAERGERLATYALTPQAIKRYSLDSDRGYNPWKIVAADVDGDSSVDICVGVWKKARFHPVWANRFFVYNWDGKQLFPKWLGSRLSSPFIDFIFQDIDNDGLEELLALELQRNGLNRIMSYKWKGFGFEGFKIVEQELKEENLSK